MRRGTGEVVQQLGARAVQACEPVHACNSSSDGAGWGQVGR